MNLSSIGFAVALVYTNTCALSILLPHACAAPYNQNDLLNSSERNAKRYVDFNTCSIDLNANHYCDYGISYYAALFIYEQGIYGL